MNIVFLTMVFISFVVTAYHQLTWVPPVPEAMASAQEAASSVQKAIAPMQALSIGILDSAKTAVTISIGLIGQMAFFLGLMKVVEKGGLLLTIAKLVRPLMIRLFPDIPSNHPAIGAIIMNMSSNALGLGNAATPFGIRAMQELDKLNPYKGTASNSMVLFLALNTSSVALLPSGVIAVRAAAGSLDPAGILPTTLFATCCSTVVAIFVAKLYQRFTVISPEQIAETQETAAEQVNSEKVEEELPLEASTDAYPAWVSFAALAGLLLVIPLAVIYGREVSPWTIPCLVIGFLGFGVARKVHVYEVLIEGAKEGFQIAVRIIPFLVAILVAVGMFRNSGAMDVIIGSIGQFTGLLGLPTDALPMAMIRPLSGQGALAVLLETINNPAIGPDSYTGYLVSTLNGSTETTFYVLAVYFGAVRVRRTRHAVAAGLTADLAGIIGAVIACSYLYGSL